MQVRYSSFTSFLTVRWWRCLLTAGATWRAAFTQRVVIVWDSSCLPAKGGSGSGRSTSGTWHQSGTYEPTTCRVIETRGGTTMEVNLQAIAAMRAVTVSRETGSARG